MLGLTVPPGRRQRRSSHTLRGPASEDRQGHEIAGRRPRSAAPRAQLWGFGRGACRVDVGARREMERLCGVKRAGGVAMVALAKSSSWLRRLSNFPENRELYRAWTFARLMVLWSSPSGGMREGQSVLKYATSRRVCPSLLLITPPKRELRSDHTWATEKTQVADAPVGRAARFRASPACRPCGDHPKAVVLHLDQPFRSRGQLLG